MGYDNLVISIKSSDVLMCIRAHEELAKQTDFPLHVGITESGTVYSGSIKSAVGLGTILYQGIGDTIRVSLTGDPVKEVQAAKLILQTLGLYKGGVQAVSYTHLTVVIGSISCTSVLVAGAVKGNIEVNGCLLYTSITFADFCYGAVFFCKDSVTKRRSEWKKKPNGGTK